MTKQEMLKEIFEAFNSGALSSDTYFYVTSALGVIDNSEDLPNDASQEERDIAFALSVVGGDYTGTTGFQAVRVDSDLMYEVYDPEGWWYFDTDDIQEVFKHLIA